MTLLLDLSYSVKSGDFEITEISKENNYAFLSFNFYIQRAGIIIIRT
jgi:hypothetical protein